MGHGGKRRGSGRKKGAAAEKTRAIADAVILKGDTPLEIMLEAMKAHRDAGRLKEAVAVAEKAAPYIHPRLTSVEVTPPPKAQPTKLMLVNGEEPPDADRAAV